jgi:hypothetical protein
MKTLLGLTAAALAASALVSPAAHADNVTFRFCNLSGTDEYVSFPYHGGWSSYVESPRNCWSTILNALSSDEAVGYRKVNQSGQYLPVATKYFSGSSGSVEFDF